MTNGMKESPPCRSFDTRDALLMFFYAAVRLADWPLAGSIGRSVFDHPYFMITLPELYPFPGLDLLL